MEYFNGLITFNNNEFKIKPFVIYNADDFRYIESKESYIRIYNNKETEYDSWLNTNYAIMYNDIPFGSYNKTLKIFYKDIEDKTDILFAFVEDSSTDEQELITNGYTAITLGKYESLDKPPIEINNKVSIVDIYDYDFEYLDGYLLEVDNALILKECLLYDSMSNKFLVNDNNINRVLNTVGTIEDWYNGVNGIIYSSNSNDNIMLYFIDTGVKTDFAFVYSSMLSQFTKFCNDNNIIMYNIATYESFRTKPTFINDVYTLIPIEKTNINTNMIQHGFPIVGEGILISENNKLAFSPIDLIVEGADFPQVPQGLGIECNGNVVTVSAGSAICGSVVGLEFTLEDDKLTIYNIIPIKDTTDNIDLLCNGVVNNINVGYDRIPNFGSVGGLGYKLYSPDPSERNLYLVKILTSLNEEKNLCLNIPVRPFSDLDILADGDTLIAISDGLSSVEYLTSAKTQQVIMNSPTQKLVTIDSPVSYTITATDGFVANDIVNVYIMDNGEIALLKPNSNKFDKNRYYQMLGQIIMKTSTTAYTKCNSLGTLNEQFDNRYIQYELLDTTGYKIYSDGWKVQWGNTSNPTFPIAFETTPSIISYGHYNPSTTRMYGSGYWFAKGY